MVGHRATADEMSIDHVEAPDGAPIMDEDGDEGDVSAESSDDEAEEDEDEVEDEDDEGCNAMDLEFVGHR